MTSKLSFDPLALKSIPLSKGALLLVMLEQRFPIKVLGFWKVEHHCCLSSVYSNVTKKYWIIFIHYLQSIEPFHQNTSPCTNSWLLKSVWNHSNFRKHWFHVKQSHKRFVETSLKHFLRKWIHVLCSGEL